VNLRKVLILISHVTIAERNSIGRHLQSEHLDMVIIFALGSARMMLNHLMANVMR
jgi:hypothetical protein